MARTALLALVAFGALVAASAAPLPNNLALGYYSTIVAEAGGSPAGGGAPVCMSTSDDANNPMKFALYIGAAGGVQTQVCGDNLHFSSRPAGASQDGVLAAAASSAEDWQYQGPVTLDAASAAMLGNPTVMTMKNTVDDTVECMVVPNLGGPFQIWRLRGVTPAETCDVTKWAALLTASKQCSDDGQGNVVYFQYIMLNQKTDDCPGSGSGSGGNDVDCVWGAWEDDSPCCGSKRWEKREIETQAQGNGAACTGADKREVDCAGPDEAECACNDVIDNIFFFNNQIVAAACLSGTGCPTVDIGGTTYHVLGDAANMNMERADDVCA